MLFSFSASFDRVEIGLRPLEGLAMLSNCQKCKYFHAEACGVNPSYRHNTEMLCKKLTTSELTYFENDISCCPDWESTEDQELLTHTVSLTRSQWRALAIMIASQQAACLGLEQALPQELRELGLKPEASGEIPMIEVQSSSIKAIGWSSGVCQVDFHSGRRYRYFKVPEWIYLNFLKAPSKGWFFNEIFNIDYVFNYELID
jgi:KTSC domain